MRICFSPFHYHLTAELHLLCSSISGDLYLVIHVEEKREIWRDGLNLYSKLDVDFTEAILGTVKKVNKSIAK